jgi:hypothetical protein
MLSTVAGGIANDNVHSSIKRQRAGSAHQEHGRNGPEGACICHCSHPVFQTIMHSPWELHQHMP